ncbi:pyridoxal phosphatase [Enterobacteriaceae bacterium RIT814]|jgi:Cof subfamily protein (haloacid dehalogenase superfamily)|uniref:Pyridoxal phosphatase n=1 Tax=Leclercia pneumoniae TaxID=2815358 RepID=A0ABX8JTQ0_9ENTR|nr:pyridoxal phosphatase [Leclercia pneumoniae]KGA99818.1 Cof-like hydrolase family protein [Enterobacteriaceae bacterium ATCC 29904]KKY80771.1 pyridoxal phosphate phosphatase [Enterobacter cloacae]MBM6606060.1 pyridoxal phosphatase [Enterobacteriaceae bacterium RIT 814]MWL72590.1 pyridoxal phosphatase [Escherichia coli]MEB7500430.1 pyridoxal phosphatase [Leclercia pneumoniae]
MTSRVIALDLDGTLLTPQKTLLPSSLEALQRAREAGYQLIIVTGRHHVAIHPFYQALALDTPAICCNGTYLYDYHAKKVLESDPLPVAQAQQLITLLDEHNVHGLMYVDEAMLYERPTGHVIRTRAWAQSLPEAQRPVFTQVASLAQAAREVSAIWKFALTDEDTSKLNDFAKLVENTLGLECEWSWHDQVDIARKGNSKGKRLTQYVESQGWSMQDVIAFGDNYNDISMLEAAGTGVAMGNADEAVKARANVVIGDNTRDSIAQFIYSNLI